MTEIPTPRNPHWTGCLTEAQFDKLTPPCRIGIVRPNPGRGFTIDWQRMVGRTRRRHAKLERILGDHESSGRYAGRMVPYEELGLIPDANGLYPAHACIPYAVRFYYCPKEEYMERNKQAFNCLLAAEPNIFLYWSSGLPSSDEFQEMPCLQAHFGDGVHFLTSGFDGLADIAGHVDEEARRLLSYRR